MMNLVGKLESKLDDEIVVKSWLDTSCWPDSFGLVGVFKRNVVLMSSRLLGSKLSGRSWRSKNGGALSKHPKSV